MQNLRVIKQACRHGTLSFFADDEYVGRSLKHYGDYSEDEVSVFQKVLKPDHIAIEVGSNIGTLTVPMAKLCKKVYAFEPQPENYKLLLRNIKDNDLDDKVCSVLAALGSHAGATRIPTLDSLGHCNYGRVEIGNGNVFTNLEALDNFILEDELIQLIKIDAEGSELEVLKGAAQTIARSRPILYVENDRKEKSAELVGWLVDHDYRCYWHRVPMFYEGNFKHETLNVFGNIASHNMICVPEESGIKVEQLDEVEDRRLDDQMYVREKARAMKRLEKDPDDFEARVLIAHYANLMNDEETAQRYIKENLLLVPDHAPSLSIFGLMALQQGSFKDGWQGYELRYTQRDPKTFGWRPHDVPHWDGTPTDETVLIWHEQGWGDSIMFSRFMHNVQKLAPNAILEVQPQLFELFELSHIVRPGQLFRTGRKLPKYSYHCSLPSIPATLKFDNEEQVKLGKYLIADQGMVDGWKKRNTPRIGICLRGGTASERAYSRDMPEEVGEKLARRFGPFITLTNEGQWESYADTAAAIEALDLVITVDTSVAHLSGALGVPTFLMLSSDPDWRWQKRRSDSPWYPSMTIFRQHKFMDWSNVIEEVTSKLKCHLDGIAGNYRKIG
jgi:FkbM family methyltransferase